MILGVDVGNTCIKMAILEDDVKRIDLLLPTRSMEEYCGDDFDDDCGTLEEALDNIKEEHPNISSILISCVDNDMLGMAVAIFDEFFGIKPKAIRNSMIPIKNKYKDKKQLGVDRLLCAYSAKSFYESPLILIDSGSATTYDVVSKEAFEGGVIAPGLDIFTFTLLQSTKIQIDPMKLIEMQNTPKDFGIANFTEAGIVSGMEHYVLGGTLSIIKEYEDILNDFSSIVLTGGSSEFIYNVIKDISWPYKVHYDPDLLFKGMHLLVKNKEKNRK